MAGRIFHKGFLIMRGFLVDRFGQDKAMALHASLTFEQLYGDIDGDSASSTELYALLSGLGDVPLKQSIAVTGSVNQRGQVQPIGGATAKIEGFYEVCRARGLTGEQGVMIPKAKRADRDPATGRRGGGGGGTLPRLGRGDHRRGHRTAYRHTRRRARGRRALPRGDPVPHRRGPTGRLLPRDHGASRSRWRGVAVDRRALGAAAAAAGHPTPAAARTSDPSSRSRSGRRGHGDDET